MGLNTNLRAFSASRLVGLKIPSKRDSKQDRATLCHQCFKITGIVNLIYFKSYIQAQLVNTSKSICYKFFRERMSFAWDLLAFHTT